MSNALTINAESANLLRSVIAADPRIKESFVAFSHIGTGSISVAVFFASKDECPNRILMNGPHRKVMLHADGEMVNLTGYKTAKFRQGKVKSVEEFADKLRKYLVKALDGFNLPA